MPFDFLKDKHPVWTAHEAEWKRRERLLRGAEDVIESELTRFDWEEEDGEPFAARKAQAVYPGFGAAFLSTLVGHVLKDRPEPEKGLYFGQLGKAERAKTGAPSQAEQVYYNVNGTGGDGQQWWQWIAAVFQRAGATGLRWVLVEAPIWTSTSTPTGADELMGQRPYAVEFSPRAVINWQFVRGQLQWCVIETHSDTRRVVDGKLEGAPDELGYYLLVRQGCETLGNQFSGGGWWRFDKEGAPIAGAEGNWLKTAGEIPMAVALWEADEGDDEIPALARSATTAIDNLSVAYMNTVSAWRSNMWRSAGGPTFLLGVDTESWKVAAEQWSGGTSLMGVPAADGGKGASPTVAHSGAAAVSAQSFLALLEHMTGEAQRMMVQQATSTADSSGRSKEAGFAESKTPRLTLLAENIEAFTNTLIRFFELRYGHAAPSGYVEMPRQFDLAPVEDDIRDFFDTFRRTSLRSATLESGAILRLAEAKGLVSDEDREAVRAELEDSAKAGATAGAQEGGMFGDLFGGAAAGAAPVAEEVA